MDWPLHCFKAYDIRGLANTEIDQIFATRLGRAIGTYLDCTTLAVGRDIRDSSPMLSEALIHGLTLAGVRVLDLGIVTTGCVYHACWTLPVDGGVMKTANHHWGNVNMKRIKKTNWKMIIFTKIGHVSIPFGISSK